MSPLTEALLARLQRGNRSATSPITTAHVEALLSDAEALGTAVLLEQVAARLAPPPTRAKGPKSDIEVLVGHVRTRSGRRTSEVVAAMYTHLCTQVEGGVPPRSKVRSLPKLLAHFEPRVGASGLREAALAALHGFGASH